MHSLFSHVYKELIAILRSSLILYVSQFRSTVFIAVAEAYFASTLSERRDGADSCRSPRSRGLRAAAAGCRRRHGGQQRGASISSRRHCASVGIFALSWVSPFACGHGPWYTFISSRGCDDEFLLGMFQTAVAKVCVGILCLKRLAVQKHGMCAYFNGLAFPSFFHFCMDPDA